VAVAVAKAAVGKHRRRAVDEHALLSNHPL
jgi:hypothetical protein